MRIYRAVWISDLHLGTPQSRAQMFLDFLKECNTQTLYLVGDIIDMQALKRKKYWRKEFWTVVQKILRLSRKGTNVVYVCGNHDALLREYLDEFGLLNLGDIRICDHWFHLCKNGMRGLVIHGDQFDGAIRSMPLLYWFGDRAYSFALFLNRILNIIRRVFGLSYWSFSSFLKKKVKKAVSYVNNFEVLVTQETKKHSVDFIVCGHIHTPEICKIEDIYYLNTGDWCESCSAIVEDVFGNLKLVDHNHEVIKVLEKVE